MFSNDVVAVEAQNAPLWDEIPQRIPEDAPKKLSKKRKAKEVWRQKSLAKKKKKKPNSSPQNPVKISGKKGKKKMVIEYTECRLCELQFNSELQLEEHLFSILHHRALSTENGEKFKHECNLCRSQSLGLSEYVKHLQSDSHRNKSESRKAAIETGTYRKPEHRLNRYTPTFQCRPKKAKKLRKAQESLHQKQTESLQNGNVPRNQMNTREYYSNDNEGEQRRTLLPDPATEWSSSGYGNWWHWDQDGSTSQVSNGFPYGWMQRVQNQKLDDHHHWNTPHYQSRPQYQQDYQDQTFWQDDAPPTTFNNFSKPLETPQHLDPYKNQAYPSSYSNERTKRLIASAHKALSNGKKSSTKNADSTTPSTSGNRKVSWSSLSGRTKGSLEEIEHPLADNVMNGKTTNFTTHSMPRRATSEGSFSSTSSSHRDDSVSSSTGKYSHRQRRTMQYKRFNTTSHPKPQHPQFSAERSITKRLTDDENVAILDRKNSQRSSSRIKAQNPPGPNSKYKLDRRPKKSNEQHLKRPGSSTDVYKQINQHQPMQLASASSYPSTDQTVQSENSKNLTNYDASNSSKHPETSENIRLKFRAILDEIDQPVVSASEILNEPRKLKDIGMENEVARKPTFSRPSDKSKTYHEVRQIMQFNNREETQSLGRSELSITNGSTSSAKDSFYSNISTSTTLETENSSSRHHEMFEESTREKSETSHSILSNQTNDEASITPQREPRYFSSDVDTPTNKRRINPQPNFSKARSRLSSRNKEVGAEVGASDTKQAKLRKLLMKYDRTKKTNTSSPEFLTPTRKPPGPRFGIDLHLVESTTDSINDIQSLAMNGDMVEILPTKRSRSLSESDTAMSFTTAMTESSAANPPVSDTSTYFPPAESSQDGSKNFESKEKPPIKNENARSLAQSLNSQLLAMSEREEELHASVRQLDVQDANVQADMDKTVNVIKELEAQLNKLKEKKACILAMKRSNEEQLTTLRQDRLKILRGTQSNNGDSTETLFQDITPNSRWHTPSFSAATCSTPTPLDKHHQNPENKIDSDVQIHTPPLNVASCEISSTVSDQNAKERENIEKAPASVPHLGLDQAPPLSSVGKEKKRNPPPVNLVNIKTEPGQDAHHGTGFPQSAKNQIPNGHASTSPIVRVKKENTNGHLDKQEEDVPPDKNLLPASSKNTKSQVESSSQEDFHYQTVRDNSDTTQANDESSSAFYTINNADSTPNRSSSEIGRILSKYSEKSEKQTLTTVTTIPEGKSPKVDISLLHSLKLAKENSAQRRSNGIFVGRKNFSPGVRRSPRKHKGSFSPANKPETASPGKNQAGNLQKAQTLLKAHDSPLVGMQLTDRGLVTCSLDETLVLHTLETEDKFSLKLNATPTAIKTFSDGAGDVIFVSTQKVITTSPDSSINGSNVIIRFEHSLQIYKVTQVNSKLKFDLTCKQQMKTRVLCMHYDKQTLFCGMRDGMVAIIPLTDKKKVAGDIEVLECHSCSAVTCLTTGIEGARRILCCGSTDCTVSVRDATDGLLLRTIQGHSKTVTCLQLTHNILYSAGVDRQVLGHNLNTGQLLHRFTGHAGVVRALQIVGSCMITLCSDRNVRLFNTNTCRLMQKPKSTSSLPLFVCVKPSGSDVNRDGFVAFVGCENGTVARYIMHPGEATSSSDDSPVRFVKEWNANETPSAFVNLTGDYECQWTGCDAAGIFSTEDELSKHVLGVHVNMYDLTEYSLDRTSATLSTGTCCQWDNCTHYFAPELDTITDVHMHVQRHYKKT